MIIAVDMRPLLSGVGGVVAYTEWICRLLPAGTAPERTIFFLNAWSSTAQSTMHSNIPGEDRAFFQIPSKVFNFLSLFLRYPHIDTLIKKQTGVRPDVLFLPNMNYGCFSRGVKIVLTVHDLSFIISPEFFSLKDRLWHRWINSSKLFSRVDHFIAVSECTKRDLMALFSIPESRISVCPLGVDPIFFSGNPLISRGSLHVPEAYIFAHSVDQRRKNASQLVEAFARLRRKEKYKNISLFLLGHEARMPRWLSHAIACTGVYDSVLYRSRASQEELRALYSYAEVFVYPSMYEGFGLPPLEAAACGTPVIASSVTSTREISGEFALLTHPYDVGSLACALEELLTNQDVRTRCVERGLRVARRYTWDRSVQKHSEVFTYVTNRN